MIMGDLNLQLKDPTHPESATFAMITEQFNLTQHVAEPTHKLGGSLDVIVTRDDCQVTDVTVHPPILSDHGLVMASILFIYEPLLLITRRIRHWKKLDRAAFRSALQAEPLFNDVEAFSSSTATDLFSSYETVMLKLIDSFLPQRTVRSRQHPLSPWFNADCRALRRQARRLERVYRRTRLPSDQAAWVHFVRKMHAAYRDREREYWKAIIVKPSKDPKKLWTTFNGLLGHRPANQHLQSSPPFKADAFLDRYFTAKIVSIRSATASSPPPEFSVTYARLSVLREITSLEQRNLIMAAAPKTCELDPVPSFLAQELIDDLLPFLTVLCNRSIQEAHLPTSQKRSILLPKLKRDGLD